MQLSIPIVISNADGYIASNGAFNNSGTTILMGNLSGTLYSCFFRFDGIALANGETIQSATIRVHSSNTANNETAQFAIRGFAADDATAPVSKADYDGRSLTTAEVQWVAPPMTSNSYYETADVGSIIQEIVNRAGWATGQAMVLTLINDGSDVGATRNLYTWESAGDPAELIINYGTGTPVPTIVQSHGLYLGAV